jgi:hypothetical protein
MSDVDNIVDGFDKSTMLALLETLTMLIATPLLKTTAINSAVVIVSVDDINNV